MHGCKDLQGLIESLGVQRPAGNFLKGKRGFYHFPAESWERCLWYASPHVLGSEEFRCICEYDIRCYNSCGGGRGRLSSESGTRQSHLTDTESDHRGACLDHGVYTEARKDRASLSKNIGIDRDEGLFNDLKGFVWPDTLFLRPSGLLKLRPASNV